MKDKRILMTGGTGFVGYWMYALCSADDLVCVGRDGIDDALRQSWDIIIHAAPCKTAEVIDCARRTDATVLFTSSGAADNPKSNYGANKLHDEELLLASGLDVRICRLYSFAGYRLPRHLALPTMIRDAMAGEPIVVWAPDQVRSYMYASDMAEWLWAILLRGQPGGVYNVGSDRPITILQLAQEVIKHFKRASIFVDHERPGSDRPYYLPDITRAREELGLELTVDFEEAIERTIRSYKNA